MVHGPPEVLGKTFSLSPAGRTVIGRDPQADVHLPSDRVSRRHCQIERVNEGMLLSDMGSSNGTLVNQVRIQGRQLLRGGEYIQTGDCLFRYAP